jgi:hypothetical protein
MFTGQHNDHTITCTVYSDGSVSFKAEALPDTDKWMWSSKEFTSLSSIINALDAYDLSVRKDFSNRHAYVIQSDYRSSAHSLMVVPVTVMSITADEQSAWVKNEKGERRKESRKDLFGSRAACEAYLERLARVTAQYDQDKTTLRAALDMHRWEPVP